MVVGRSEIEAAAHRIAPHTRVTPVMACAAGAFGSPAETWLKLELLQATGVFKARGASNRILSASPPEAGVIAASGGNHGLAVAYVAQRVGVTATIFVPESCPAIKVERLRSYDADVVQVGPLYAEALEASTERAQETGALVVHAYDQPEIIAGQGTVAREIADQVPGVDAVLVAVGGGGLIGGVAAWFGDDARIVGVEPEGSTSMTAARAAGEPVDVEIDSYASDSLGARRVGRLAHEIAERHVDDIVLISDDAIRDAQRHLWHHYRLIVEPGGAAAAGALLSGAYAAAPGERVVVLVCGANTDPGAVTAL